MVYMLLGTGFEETEAVAPIDLLRRAGVSVATVGIGGKVIVGSHGIPVTADMELGQMDLTQLDMIVLPGGMKGVASIKSCPEALEAVQFAWGKRPVRRRHLRRTHHSCHAWHHRWQTRHLLPRL